NDNILDLSNYRSQPDQAYTSSELTNSDTLNESPLDEPHKHLFKNGKLQTPFSPTIVDDKLGDLVSSILGENTDSNETLFQPEKETDWSSSINNESSTTLFENIDLESTGPETATNTLSVDNELGDLVSSILGENTESDEPRFDQTIETEASTETDWLAQLTGETNTGKSVTDEPEYKQTDNETSETAINTTSNDDEVSELVANLLGEDADSIETLSQMEDATYSNTSDDDTTDIVNDILKKYAQEGDNQSGQNTGLDTLDSDTTPSNDKFVVDEELQKILESTTDSNAIVSDTPVSDTPVSNASVTSAPTQTTQSKKAETESRSTQRTTPMLRGSVTKSKYSITTQSNKGGQGKVHVNVTSGPDTPSSGWKWALASLVPIAIIAMVWTYLRSDDEVNQLATSMDNMALYASKRESISTSARNNTTREESIEDVVQRMTETDTTSPLETATYSEFSPVFVPEVIPEAIPEVEQPVSQEIVQEEFAVAAVASPIIEPTSGLTQNGEQNLQNLTDHISRLEATITDLQQTAAAQDAAVTQAQETANTLPVEKITQLIDVPVANLQQGVDQRFMELGARITRLESAVKELHQSALLMKQEVMKQEVARQKATSENNENAVLSQGNQQQINTLTQRLSEIESSLQDQAAKISSNEAAQALQQKELQQKTLSGNKAVANKASVALSQGNQQQIQSLTHRIKKVESSLQDHSTDISHTKIIVGNSTVPATGTGTGTGTNTGTGTGTDNSVGAGQALIEKDNSGITITLNKPASGQPGVNSEYRMITHIVVKNDTLWSIAKRYVKNPYLYPELARLSNIKNPNRIYPGNQIRIIQFID
ncbi:MAG: LysM peptidoglycan-binding domain-containing protein, partial [Gammaproteobacteria bacterium]|nr:LysM peptidoglycan-binding domain-containing protein [Gammaproteobacteria bacterium]